MCAHLKDHTTSQKLSNFWKNRWISFNNLGVSIFSQTGIYFFVGMQKPVSSKNSPRAWTIFNDSYILAYVALFRKVFMKHIHFLLMIAKIEYKCCLVTADMEGTKDNKF